MKKYRVIDPAGKVYYYKLIKWAFKRARKIFKIYGICNIDIFNGEEYVLYYQTIDYAKAFNSLEC